MVTTDQQPNTCLSRRITPAVRCRQSTQCDRTLTTLYAIGETRLYGTSWRQAQQTQLAAGSYWCCTLPAAHHISENRLSASDNSDSWFGMKVRYNQIRRGYLIMQELRTL